MNRTPRDELDGVDRAVSETLDEVNVRMHGLMSSGSYHAEFCDWLAERGYEVVDAADLERQRAIEAAARQLVAAEDRRDRSTQRVAFDAAVSQLRSALHREAEAS